MKKTYSEYNVCKAIRSAVSSSAECLSDLLIKEAIADIENNDRWAKFIAAALEALLLEGSTKHIFCSLSLFEWLESKGADVPITADHVSRLFFNEATKHPTSLCIHVEGGNSPCGLVCGKATIKNQAAIVVLTPQRLGKERFISWTSKPSKDCRSDNYRLERFVNGLMLYISCFDNVLVDGVPEDMKHKGRFRTEKSFCLIPRKEIMGAGHVVSPHFRNGHFRLLTSPKFVNKRGQTVFVSECFVKGTAKTVTIGECI